MITLSRTPLLGVKQILYSDLPCISMRLDTPNFQRGISCGNKVSGVMTKNL
jgi:hypothetical protein